MNEPICPRCKAQIVPKVLFAIRNSEMFNNRDGQNGTAIFACTACYHPFICDISTPSDQYWTAYNAQPASPEKEIRLPQLRSQIPGGKANLSVADYVGADGDDYIGVFAITAGGRAHVSRL